MRHRSVGDQELLKTQQIRFRSLCRLADRRLCSTAPASKGRASMPTYWTNVQLEVYFRAWR
jgi:hypothetical protein